MVSVSRESDVYGAGWDRNWKPVWAGMLWIAAFSQGIYVALVLNETN